jgi:hypothetical protein
MTCFRVLYVVEGGGVGVGGQWLRHPPPPSYQQQSARGIVAR